MKQYDYSSYSEYIKIQTAAYFDKINNIWVKKDTIKYISDMILFKIPEIKKGLCHGAKRGHEVKWFRKFLKCENIIGTEIAESKNKYIIQWDFHKVKSEWINSMDFIYSNSLDHAFNPKGAINAWCSCLNENGFLIIEHSLQHGKSTSADPFGVSCNELIKCITEWTNRKYKVVYVLEPEKPYKNRRSKLLFIESVK